MTPQENLFNALALASVRLNRRLTKVEWLTAAGEWIAKTFPAKPPKKAKPMSKMTEEEFLAMLEAEPTLKGCDIRREIGKCQFWCKNNGKDCSRKRIVNWLNNADKTIQADQAGRSSRQQVAPDIYKEPAGWQRFAEKLHPDTDIGARKWNDLDPLTRNKIIKAML